MRLETLLAEAAVTPSACTGRADLLAVCSDSRKCKSGTCFVALKGTSVDGHRFISTAIQAGVSAIVCQEAPASLPDDVACVVVPDTHEVIGPLAQALHGWPAKKLTCIGVTGTNGKSTITHLVHSILTGAGIPTAMVGTISYHTPKRVVPANMTTPAAEDLAAMMAEMVADGATHLVMEASSHALDQRRTAGVPFAVAAFTNLSGDHLDYHNTMEEYLQAKCRLFRDLPPEATAVLNRDDAAAETIAGCTSAKVCWYGLSPLADLRGRIDVINADGTAFDLVMGETTLPVHTSLIGRHNVFNSLAAIGICQALGMNLATVAELLGKVQNVPGRLQRIPTDEEFRVFVDYAHTDDALANVLSSIRPITRGRVIVLFGCGGDRDRTKRPRMAKVAAELADCVIITSDNPRNEDPMSIIEEICTGLTPGDRAKVHIQPDRRQAIELAIGLAGSEDVVLLAGKGHEN